MPHRFAASISDLSAEQFAHLHAITPSELGESHPVADYFSLVSDELAHIPFSEPYFAAFSDGSCPKH
jgi:hypothetical protein